jgi:hypothetical protein
VTSLSQENTRRTSILAWTLCVVAIVAMIGGQVFLIIGRRISPGAENLLEHILLSVGFASLPVIGALVAARHPRNAEGWLFLAVGLGIGVLALSTEYARWGLDQRPHPPGLALAALLSNSLWLPSVGLLGTVLLVLFPDGKPPSPRWRWLVWASAATIAVMFLAALFQDTMDVDGTEIDNPIGLGILDNAEAQLGPLFAVSAVLLVLCALSLVVRFYRSRGVERQQLKWLAFAGFFTALGIPLELPLLFAASLLMLVGALAAAMLKYRLYEIDRIINKALVYGALTSLLVAGYAGCVLLIQAVLPLSDSSDAAIAASTLAMAALFGPLRTRIQRVVDRRFYRSNFDAQRTIELFSGRLREETDLDTLSTDLLSVVTTTIQPATAFLWLRSEDVVAHDIAGKST